MASTIAGAVLLALVLAARGATANSYVRSRLWTSFLLFLVYTLPRRWSRTAGCRRASPAQIRIAAPLLLAFGIANALVVLAVNPWRVDRIPDHFPKIVQDTIVIGLFVLAAMLFMPERIVATTAVGAVVIGFALQDTLGNLFAGLAIQIEKPFRVGHWVTIGGIDGMVSEDHVARDEDPHQGRQLRRSCRTASLGEGHDHELLGADERHAGRGRGRRQLRHAAERGEGGDPAGASAASR